MRNSEVGIEMKKCCFVTQEDENGVVTLIRETILHWPSNSSQELVILCNRNHWAFSQFRKLKDEGRIVEVIEAPFLTTHDVSKRLRSRFKSKILLKIFGGFMHLLHFFLLPWHLIRLRKLILTHKIDVIFSHNGGYPGGELNRLAVIAAKAARIKSNYMIIHNFPVSMPAVVAWLYWIEDKIIGASAKRIFSVSFACAQAVKEKKFWNKDIGVIPNGFRTEAAGDSYVNESDISWIKAKPVILFSGQLHPRKGLDVLFEALAGIDRPFSLVLYGKGETEYVDHLNQKAKDQGFINNVYFEGYHPNVLQMIRYCHFLVLPSIAYESFGMVLLEAMYWRKPVICSDFGGMKEVVVDRHTGIIVPAQDAAALRSAIVYMIDNPKEVAQWGVNGYERLKTYFDIRLIAKRYSDLC